MAIPVAKISETLLAFAEPLLGSAPESLTWAEVEGALKLAWTVWNAAVMDATRENPQFLAEMRKLVAQDYPIAQMVEGLITRKQTQFGHDLRLLGEYRIVKRAGEWRLRVEVRSAACEKSPNETGSAKQRKRPGRQNRRAITSGEVSERQIAALREARAPDRFADLDAELKDWNS